jgi:hypothetical protein
MASLYFYNIFSSSGAEEDEGNKDNSRNRIAPWKASSSYESLSGSFQNQIIKKLLAY